MNKIYHGLGKAAVCGLAAFVVTGASPSGLAGEPRGKTATPAPSSTPADKPRLLVLADIGGGPDDQQSLIRLMLYVNEFEIEGLIASASGTPGELKEAVTKPRLIRQIVEAYGKVQANLAQHAEGYPDAQRLVGRVKSGNPQRGRGASGVPGGLSGPAGLVHDG